MDQFKRKSKDAAKSEPRKEHDRHTISVMERGAVANMV